MKTLLMTLTLTMTLEMAMAGTEKGNGGDVVRCNGKLQTLDSAVMEDAGNYQIRREKNHEISLKKIEERLKKTVPSLARSLNNFLSLYKSKGSLNDNAIWIPGIPRDIKDENLSVEIPTGCTNLQQSIVRIVEKGESKEDYDHYDNYEDIFKKFYYNKNLLSELEKEQDELSWQLVHEWLRSYVQNQNTDTVRILNAYIHSEKFYSDEKDDVNKILSKFMNKKLSDYPSGLKKNAIGKMDLFDHTFIEEVVLNADALLGNYKNEVISFVNLRGHISKEEEVLRCERIGELSAFLDTTVKGQCFIESDYNCKGRSSYYDWDMNRNYVTTLSDDEISTLETKELQRYEKLKTQAAKLMSVYKEYDSFDVSKFVLKDVTVGQIYEALSRLKSCNHNME